MASEEKCAIPSNCKLEKVNPKDPQSWSKVSPSVLSHCHLMSDDIIQPNGEKKRERERRKRGDSKLRRDTVLTSTLLCTQSEELRSVCGTAAADITGQTAPHGEQCKGRRVLFFFFKLKTLKFRLKRQFFF